MEKDSGLELTQLRVDGGAANNNLMLQFQSDLLQAPVIRPRNTETTALGAALLAGLAVGFYPDLAGLSAQENPDRVFEPSKDRTEVIALRSQWNRAVERSKAWSMED